MKRLRDWGRGQKNYRQEDFGRESRLNSENEKVDRPIFAATLVTLLAACVPLGVAAERGSEVVSVPLAVIFAVIAVSLIKSLREAEDRAA